MRGSGVDCRFLVLRSGIVAARFGGAVEEARVVSSEAGGWLGKVPSEDRLTSTIRVVLASSALLIILLDPSEPDRFVALTYSILSLYSLYSVLLLAGVSRGHGWARWLSPWCHWLDVFWYTVLVALSSGSHSIFFFGLFFPIMVASFREGFRSGVAVTLTSAFLFTLVGLTVAPTEATFSWNRLLLRPTYLLLLGYMMAYWGEMEIRMKRRLALLSTITTLSNPRLGAESILGSALAPIREFFNAETCLLIVREPTGQAFLQRSSAGLEKAAPEAIDANFGDLLLRIPEGLSVIFNPGRRWPIRPEYLSLDPLREKAGDCGRAQTETVAAALDAGGLLSAPISYGGERRGRIYLLRRNGSFARADLEFCSQVIQHLTPVLDHIELVDRLAITAAEEERTRVARDIHDSVIQPYIGLQMGLTAIRDRLRRGGDATLGVEQLIQTADSAIQDLRRYVKELRGPGTRAESLLDALKRFARRFGELTGIEVEIRVEPDLRMSDRLAGETFQMVAEGLSNVRRHSQADRAVVSLAQPDGLLVIQIDNPAADALQPFFPRSLSERAESLGGRAQVIVDQLHQTTVRIEIPLDWRSES